MLSLFKMKYFNDFDHIKKVAHAKTLTYRIVTPTSVLNENILKELKRIGTNINDTVRILLHSDINDRLHNMIIFHPRGKYFIPHKHANKNETYHIIEGSAKIILFSNSGKEINNIPLSNKYSKVCRLEKNIYHVFVPVSKHVIYHESRPGPFNSRTDAIEKHFKYIQ